MSHPQQIDFVAKLSQKFPELFVRTNVLEIGSLNINGSIRQFFQQCNYIGVDIGEGRDVDLVARGEELTYSDGMFDVVWKTSETPVSVKGGELAGLLEVRDVIIRQNINDVKIPIIYITDCLYNTAKYL